MHPVFTKRLQKARQCVQARNYGEALKLYSYLVKDVPECGIEYGRAATQIGDFALAARIWHDAKQLSPTDAAHLALIAAEFGRIGLYSKSRALFFEAAKHGPKHLDVQIKNAWLLSRTGGMEMARDAVNTCLALKPDDPQARFFAACLERREQKLDLAEKQLRDLLAAPLPPHVHCACHAELAQILDRTERFDEAIAIAEAGKHAARKSTTSEAERKAFFQRQEAEIQAVKNLPKDILRQWTRAFPQEHRNACPTLAFLTGSARSGTTLLERVLDAHPSVTACDEVLAFQKIQPQVGLSTTPIPIQRLNALRERYANNLTLETGAIGVATVLLDKNPSRTLWLPALLRLFPDLKVLIALRDPRDILLSIYFQDHPNTNSLDFEQLARRYANVMDVWLAVREWDGLAWIETRYEDVVKDLSTEGSRVTAFLGLEWDAAQAVYHEQNRDKPILSTNYSDVTRPVYSGSVARWRAYEKHLGPALPILEPYCKRFGFA
jgi:tetratricopeptide (TPR) repeat protein